MLYLQKLVLCFFLLSLGNGVCMYRAMAVETAPAKGEVEGFALEIPDENGQRQAILEGSKAQFDPAGTIKIMDVRAKIHQQEKGGVVVLSSQAYYHRDSKIVTTDEAVRVDSRDTHITGTGLVWEPEKAKIFIQEKVRVVLKNVDKETGESR